MNDQSQNDAGELQRTDEHSQAEITPPRNALARPLLTAGAHIAAIIPRSFEDVQRIANMAVKSGLASRDVNSLERCSYVIMFGLEIGMKPLASLQRIAIIGGRPCVWGEAVPAIAIDTGELVEFKEWQEGTGNDFTCYCKVVRKLRNGSVMEKTSKFSIAQAKRANLWDVREKVTRRNRSTGENYTADNDSPWYRFPERMLQMRARVAFRDLFADAMCGLYIAEELVGRDADAQMRDVTPQYERIANPLGGDGDPITTEELDKAQFGRVLHDRPEAGGKPQGASGAESGGGQPPDGETHHGPPQLLENGNKRKRTRPVGGTVVGGAQPTVTGNEATTSNSPAHPRPSGEEAVWDIKFPTPWQRQSSASYTAYALAWMAVAPGAAMAKARWDTERAIRNNIANPLDKAQMVACQGALAKVGS